MPPRATLAGIGSIVDAASARQSFEFTNFRIGEIKGWRRVFGTSNWVNVANGDGSVAAGDTAALAMVPAAADFVSQVALMDVDVAGLAGFYEREAGYNIVSVPFTERGGDGAGDGAGGVALLCAACANDHEADALWTEGGAMARHCPGSEYVRDWMRRSLRPMWPPPGAPLFPAPGYLRLCAEAHRRAGMLTHFLDSTLLHDGRVLREYVLEKQQLHDLLEQPQPPPPQQQREEGLLLDAAPAPPSASASAWLARTPPLGFDDTALQFFRDGSHSLPAFGGLGLLAHPHLWCYDSDGAFPFLPLLLVEHPHPDSSAAAAARPLVATVAERDVTLEEQLSAATSVAEAEAAIASTAADWSLQRFSLVHRCGDSTAQRAVLYLVEKRRNQIE